MAQPRTSAHPFSDAAGPSAITAVPPAERMLLLPHCLRPSQGCPGKMTATGLDCTGCGRADCKVAILAAAARDAGYGHIHVVPGGRLAVRLVSAAKPAAIVAVACDKELDEGEEAVAAMEWPNRCPAILRIPLCRDGCVDTDVDTDAAARAIRA